MSLNKKMFYCKKIEFHRFFYFCAIFNCLMKGVYALNTFMFDFNNKRQYYIHVRYGVIV